MLRKLLSFICCILFLTLLNTAGAAGRGTILFVPLDNRPVCMEYSVNSMQAAGWNVETPPEEYIASNHRSGNPDKLYEWLAERAPLANAVIVSSDAMLYGGLVDSRTHHIDREVLKERAERLVSLKDLGGDPLFMFLQPLCVRRVPVLRLWNRLIMPNGAAAFFSLASLKTGKI